MRPHRRAFLLLSILAGCAGGIDDPDQFPPPTCTIRGYDVPADLFATRCANSGCHAAESPAAGLDLASPNVATRMIDTASAGCGPRLLIDTSSPTVSYLLDKVSAVPRCGQTMPIGGPPLSPAERACLGAWVDTVATPTPGDP